MGKKGDGTQKLMGLEALADLHRAMGGERAEWPAEHAQDAPVAGPDVLYVSLDRKARRGKEVTLVEGFDAGAHDGIASDLARSLKALCGVGGGWKDGVILLQGDHRDRVVDSLNRSGYRVKRKGG